jgi:hypothetical protein
LRLLEMDVARPGQAGKQAIPGGAAVGRVT